jgi:uncharacterized protein (DUF1697 family)
MLRGINVAGRNRVAMEDLRGLVRALGSEDVRTYVQSGNVVFRSHHMPSDLAPAIEGAIQRTLGVDVTVVLRTKEQLAQVTRRNPFGRSGVEPAKLHVTFLADVPASDRVRDLRGRAADPDEFHVVGREIYLHCPNGYGRTRLSNSFLERQLALPATTRNWKTVTTLADMAKA